MKKIIYSEVTLFETGVIKIFVTQKTKKIERTFSSKCVFFFKYELYLVNLQSCAATLCSSQVHNVRCDVQNTRRYILSKLRKLFTS